MASVEARGNRYRVVWRLAGRKQYERFANQADAVKFARLVEAHDGQWPRGWVKGAGFGETASTSPTFAAWAERWVQSRSTANDRTRHDYRRDLDRHVLPTFGATAVDLITAEDVGRWLLTMQQSTLSAKTIKNVHGLASAVMGSAVDQGLASSNPFRRALRSLPTVRQEEMVFLTRTEFDTLVRHVPEEWRPLVLLLGLTGLRWGEATSLKVGDIDVMSRRLTVVRAWKRTPEGTFVLGEPKSRRSRRTISLTPTLVDALLPLLTARRDEDLVFTTRLGNPVLHANFRYRVWLPAVAAMRSCPSHGDEVCKCVGTVRKSPRIHDLRHSQASWLIAAGINLAAVQRRLGHESIQTTVDRYGHLAPETDDEITAALEGSAAREPVDA